MAPLTQSYVHGASPTPLSGETIGRLLRRVVLEGPDRPALVTRHQGVRWTYADLLRRSEDLAIGLRALGLKKGDRVGIWSANVSEWVLAQFGTALAGLDPRQHQSRLPRARIRIRDEEVRLPGADPERRPQEQRLFRLPARLRARDRRGRNRANSRPEACRSSRSSSAWGPTSRGGCSTSTTSPNPPPRPNGLSSRPSKRRCSSTIRSTSSSLQEPPARRKARR